MDNEVNAGPTSQTPTRPAALPAPETRDSGGGFRGCVRFVASLLIVILLGVLLGLGVFYGVPYLYQQYVRPIEISIQELQDVQALQEQNNAQIGQRLDGLVERIEALEVQGDTARQSFDEFDARLAALEESQSAALAAQESLIATAAAELSAAQTESQEQIDQLDEQLSDLESQLNANSEAIAALEGDLQALGEQVSAEVAPVQALRLELQLVKAMELLTRGRVFLLNNNLGLAEAEIVAARDMLLDLDGRLPDAQTTILTDVIARLEDALENMPDRPVLAAENLELAWQLLRDDWPGVPALLENVEGEASQTGQSEALEGTETPESAGTPAPEETEDATETPEATPTPTPTPGG